MTSSGTSVHGILRTVNYDVLFGHVWQYRLPLDKQAEVRKAPEQHRLLLNWIKQLDDHTPWRPCDYGEVGDDGTMSRTVDASVRVCMRRQVDHWQPGKWFDGPVKELIVDSGLRVDIDSINFEEPEVLRYGVGGHFKPHADRQLGRGHVGTFLIVVPTTDLEGGVLIVGEGVGVVTSPSPSSSYMVFIPLGVTHEVTPVSAGERYVFKAAVYAKLLTKRQTPKPVERLRD